jgi:hypothetical protein
MYVQSAKPSQERRFRGGTAVRLKWDVTMISPDESAPILELEIPLATLERVGGKRASLARLATASLFRPVFTSQPLHIAVS